MQGTAEHECVAECLVSGFDPASYLGRQFVFLPERVEMWIEQLPAEDHFKIIHTVTIDDEAIDRMEAYVGFVRDLVSKTGGVLLVERRVPIDHITGEPGAGGTTDVAILTDHEVVVVDYKSGQERIDAYEVIKPAGVNIITGEQEAAVLGPNLQLAHYASGTLRDYGWMIPSATRARLVIVQPRLNHISEYALSVDALNQRIEWIKQKAEETRCNPVFVPTNENCHFCPARFDCEPREKACLEIALEGFTPGDCQSLIDAKPRQIDGQWLGVLHDKMPMLKQFMKDVHIKLYTELAAGRPVVNSEGEPLKLVEGRGGHRYWVAEQRVKEVLISYGLKEQEMFNIELRSPSQLEALTKGKRQGSGLPMLPPRIKKPEWNALAMLIDKPKGKPVIAKVSDDRPAITPSLEGFTDLSTLVEDEFEDQDD